MKQFNEIIKNDEVRRRMINYLSLPLAPKESYDNTILKLKELNDINVIDLDFIKDIIEHDYNYLADKYNETELNYDYIVEKVKTELNKDAKWVDFVNSEITIDIPDNVVTNFHRFYTNDNAGRYFVSVDLKSANWQSVKDILKLDKDVKYEDFVSPYIDTKLPIISKPFRGKIFSEQGKLIKYNQALLVRNMKDIINLVNENKIPLSENNLVAIYADEFLVEVSKDVFVNWDEDNVKYIKELIMNELGIEIHLTCFKLANLNIGKTQARIEHDGTYEYKLISSKLKYALMLTEANIGSYDTKEYTEAKEMVKALERELEGIKP